MRFDELYKRIVLENNLSGDGSVFGPGSVNSGPDMQGDSIYNPGDYRVPKGMSSVINRSGSLFKRKKSRKKKLK